MIRPPAKHIDNDELKALASSPSETKCVSPGLSKAVKEAMDHVASCRECGRRLWKYRILENGSAVASEAVAFPKANCPSEVEWFDVVLGLWPEHKASQLIAHAALCSHCGPQLRAAVALNNDPTPEEEAFLTGLRPPLKPEVAFVEQHASWKLLRWLVPAFALLLIVVALSRQPLVSTRSSTESQFPEFAVRNHRQLEQGVLALDLHSDSQQAINKWLRLRSPFFISLPESPGRAGKDWPYRPQGAQLVKFAGSTAVLLAYRATGAAVSTEQLQPIATLTVVPESVARASGGIEANFTRVSFHYANVDGRKVVTWSQHGLTYALVSNEGNGSQRSCMVCHSPLADRDLSETPTPLPVTPNLREPALQ